MGAAGGPAAALPARAILMCRHYTAYGVCLRVGCNSNVTASRLTRTLRMLHNIKNRFYFRGIHGWVYMLVWNVFLTFMNCKYCKLLIDLIAAEPHITVPQRGCQSAQLPCLHTESRKVGERVADGLVRTLKVRFHAGGCAGAVPPPGSRAVGRRRRSRLGEPSRSGGPGVRSPHGIAARLEPLTPRLGSRLLGGSVFFQTATASRHFARTKMFLIEMGSNATRRFQRASFYAPSTTAFYAPSTTELRSDFHTQLCKQI